MQDDVIDGELIPSPRTSLKVYDGNAILVASFFGGPLAVGYLMTRNFIVLDKKQKIASVWIWLIVICGALFEFALFFKRGPSIWLLLVFCSATYFLFERLQDWSVSNHLKLGGGTYSVWRALLVSLIALMTYCVGAVIVILVVDILIFY